jgi:diguanylate cyclase (GGDEF)-like protein
MANHLKAAELERSEDPVTGLPGRAAAEHAIEDRLAARKSFALALFAIDEMATINSRFGHSTGDDILVGCAHMIAKKLSGAMLYRWSGPALVALFDPSLPAAEAEARAAQAAGQKLEKSIDTENRTAMIVVVPRCHVQHISVRLIPQEIFREVDGFVAAKQA